MHGGERGRAPARCWSLGEGRVKLAFGTRWLGTDVPGFFQLVAAVRYVLKRSRSWKQLMELPADAGSRQSRTGLMDAAAALTETLHCSALKVHVSISCKMLLNCMEHPCSDEPRLCPQGFVHARTTLNPPMPGAGLPSHTGVSSETSPSHPMANTHLVPKLFPFCPREAPESTVSA